MADQPRKTFFSYAHADSEFTLRLVKELRAAGVSVWLDQLDIKPGELWDSAIENALGICPNQLIVLSPDSVNSVNVMDEVSFALEQCKRVIPVLYRDCHIPFRLRRVQYIDFRNDYQAGMVQLLQILTPDGQVGSPESSRELTSVSGGESSRQIMDSQHVAGASAVPAMQARTVGPIDQTPVQLQTPSVSGEWMGEENKHVPAPRHDVNEPFLMPIEDIFSISGRGTAATGTIKRGKIKINEEVEIVGFRETRRTMVMGVEMSRKLLDEASAGDSVGILLGHINEDEVQCGMVLAKPGSITAHTRFKAEVYMLTTKEGGRDKPFFKGYRPLFYFHTTHVTGVAELPPGTERVMPGDSVTLTIELITAVAMEKGLRFAIREDDKTVGAGTIAEIIQ